MKLQQSRGEDPDRRASHMRQHGTGGSHPDTAAGAQHAVTQRDREITVKDAEAQAMVAAARPPRRHERSHHRTQATSTKQNTHPEHRPARSIDTATAYPKPRS